MRWGVVPLFFILRYEVLKKILNDAHEFLVAQVGMCHATALSLILKANPSAAEFEAPRRIIRDSLASDHVPFIRAFTPAAAVLFDEYAQWRQGAKRDVDYRSSAQAGPTAPFEPLVK